MSGILDTSKRANNMKNYTVIIVLFILTSSFTVLGQQDLFSEEQEGRIYKLSEKAQDQLIKKGNKLYEQGAYMESVLLYKDLEHNAEIDVDTKAKMAEAYRRNAEYELAEYWYRQFVDQDSDPTTVLNFAKVLQANDKCDEASKWYKKYLSSNPLDASDVKKFSDCENLKAILEHDGIIFYNLEDVNTPFAEYGAMIMDYNLVFTSTRNLHKVAKHEDMWSDAAFSDLFVASTDEFGAFTEVDRLRGSVNRKFHDGLSAR